MTKRQYKKLDDADWHENDAANRIQAGMHIALVYFWLMSRGLTESDEPSKKLADKFQERSTTPGNLFENWADGKLILNGATSDVTVFLKDFYTEHGYFLDVASKHIPGLTYDKDCLSPYDIEDTWRNVDKASIYFDKRYRKWRRQRKGYRPFRWIFR